MLFGHKPDRFKLGTLISDLKNLFIDTTLFTKRVKHIQCWYPICGKLSREYSLDDLNLYVPPYLLPQSRT